MVVETGSAVRLTTDPAADMMPAWSPDNRWIAFLRDKQGIFLISSDWRRRAEFTDWPGDASQLSWSPDGKHLAFARGRERSEPGGIFVIPAQGGAAKRITRADSFAHFTPAFFPDGRRLAFTTCVSDMSCDISLVEFGAAFEASQPPRRFRRTLCLHCFDQLGDEGAIGDRQPEHYPVPRHTASSE